MVPKMLMLELPKALYNEASGIYLWVMKTLQRIRVCFHWDTANSMQRTSARGF